MPVGHSQGFNNDAGVKIIQLVGKGSGTRPACNIGSERPSGIIIENCGNDRRAPGNGPHGLRGEAQVDAVQGFWNLRGWAQIQRHTVISCQ
jgi:hypothetical protein